MLKSLHNKAVNIVIAFMLVSVLSIIFVGGAQADAKNIKFGFFLIDPLVQKNDDNIYSGSIIEIMEYIALQEGWNLEYIECKFPECLKLLETSEIDLMAPIALTEGRQDKFDFIGESFFVDWGQIYAPHDSQIESLLDLNGKKVAVLRNTNQYC